MSWKPSLWASRVPRDPRERKPNHYLEMARVTWANRDNLPYALRILREGVCDGCALGTSGVRDWTLDGMHLCMVRLELMRLNTAPALDPGVLSDVERLRALSSRELRDLGRIPEPMVRRGAEPGFRVIPWEEAYALAAEKIREAARERFAVYLTSRGVLNEHYYAAQKAARAMGTNHVDNSARLCHAASTVAMKQTLGHGASTCSYRDWLESDLIVFFGSNTPNNQPVTTKYLYHARQRGTRVAMVNPYEEPGLRRYWIPSVPESALFGTRLCDEWFAVDTGGDLAFLNGVFKVLVQEDWIDREFVQRSTAGFDAAAAHARAQDWEALERESGTPRAEMERFARLLSQSRRGIFVWSMGLTQHAHGVPTIQALINVGLARGWVGRTGAGLMPIRGHSGVQGGAEVGCAPLSEADAERYAAVWGFEPPRFPGMTATEMVSASAAGELDVLWTVGGNFLETMPDPDSVAQGLARIPTRIHHDVVLSSMMLVPASGNTLILPATTRYESPGGGTETSTERRIIFSPEVRGPRIGSARCEWKVFGEVAARVAPERAAGVRFQSSQQIRDEIARAVPLYAGIEKLRERGDQFQWGGGPQLYADGEFPVPGGKAHFSCVAAPERRPAPERFFVSTRRGKQFNSMVQHDVDPLNGARREDVLISAEDAAALGLREGDGLRLVSASGSFTGRTRIERIKPGNLEVHWPEANGLLSRDEVDRLSHEPDYNAVVRVEPASRPPAA